MSERGDTIQSAVVGMYTEHPSPSRRDKLAFASRRMRLRLRCCGVREEHYVGKQVLDAGCGTGEYSSWFASQGARVTGIDLSDGSLAEARRYAELEKLSNLRFEKRSVLNSGFPDEQFDFVYCTGVLHHTPAPYEGFTELCRVLKPGGRILASLYNSYGFFPREMRRRVAKLFGGQDLSRRVTWGRRLFPFTTRRLLKGDRYDEQSALYDYFAIPHESLHTLGEMLRWFDRAGLTYSGTFAPARLRDYLPLLADRDYNSIEQSYRSRLAPLIGRFGVGREISGQRPGPISRAMVQILWLLTGVGMVSMCGIKPETTSTRARV
jgi:2-polyprenyl-3-methyl-5-hydroxy-6-metoxy-1,4-benzoquinol methylase